MTEKHKKVSSAQLLEYKEAFSSFDKDNDGKISVAEFSEILESLGTKHAEEEVRSMLAEISSDGKTAAVTFPDFIKAMEMFALNKELVASFQVFDINGDGFITFSELKQVMEKKFGADKVSDANIRAMIEKADMDGDGRVNYSEFVQLLS